MEGFDSMNSNDDTGRFLSPDFPGLYQEDRNRRTGSGGSGGGLYTVAELINMAFQDKNKVHFKLIHIILLVLAKKLNVSSRTIHVGVPCFSTTKTGAFMSMDEIRICAQKQSETEIAHGKISQTYKDIKRKSQEVFAKESIYIIKPPIEEEQLPKETCSRITTVPLSLTTRDLYLELLDRVNKIQKHFGFSDFDLSKSGYGNVISSTVHNMSARLEKTERLITDITLWLDVLRKGRCKEVEELWGFRGSKSVVTVLRVDENEGSLKDDFKSDHDSEQPEQEFEHEFEEETEQESEHDSERESEQVEFQEVKKTRADEPICKDDLIFNKLNLKKYTKDAFAKLKKELNKLSRETREMFINLVKNTSIIKTTILTVEQLKQEIADYKKKQRSIDQRTELAIAKFEKLLNTLENDIIIGIEKLHEDIRNLKTNEEDLNSTREIVPQFYATNRMLTEQQLELDLEQQTFQNSVCQDLVLKLLDMQENKCKREEFYTALKEKVGLQDINNKIEITTCTAQVGDIQHRLAKNINFQAQELRWQSPIDGLHKRLDKIMEVHQFESFNADVFSTLNKLRARIDDWISMVKPLERTREKVPRVLGGIKKCMSCGTRPRQAFCDPKGCNRSPEDKTFSTESIEKGSEDTKAICVPMTPIPKRKGVCSKKPCENDNEDIRDALMSILNSSIKKTQIYYSDTQLIKVPCKPCNKPKAVSFEQKMDDPCPHSDENPSCRGLTAMTSQ